ncbi:MAG: isochorismatase family cysteine hydrolase [Cyanobacteria bacterium P01_D01_bin.36]
MSHITAEPYNYELPSNLSRLALVIVDMQRDFLEPGGFGEMLGNDVSQLQKIVPVVQQLQTTFRSYGLSIIQTREGHRPDLYDCPPSKKKRGKGNLTIGDQGPMGRILVLGEPGNAIIDPLAPLGKEMVISKPGKGAFYNTKLHRVLRSHKISHLIFTGVTTEVCVQSTMREANDRGYECLLVEDATESYFPEFKQSTLEMIRAQGGIVGWTATAEQVITGISAAISGN